jgi:hypothetical protein
MAWHFQLTPVTPLIPRTVSAAKVPEGWYSHELDGFEGLDFVLAKTPDFSKVRLDGSVEHIAIVDRDTTVTPEQYLKENPIVDESDVQFAIWSTLYGRKMFSVGFTNASDGSKEQSIYLFGGIPANDSSGNGHVVMVNIYPDTQENHPAFEQVVNYYAQTLPMISRTETMAACKTINLPPRKEYDMTADPQTGYVTVLYHDASGTEQHVFFNYRDDASQCTPSVKALLGSITGQGPALLP